MSGEVRKFKMKWECDDCHYVCVDGGLLEAANPFNKELTISGCPNCFSVGPFNAICDEPGCEEPVCMGTPTPDGYRNMCRKHGKDFI